MSKAYSKAAKRRAKKGVVGMFQKWAQEPVTPVVVKEEEDPLKAPMRARANRLGEEPSKSALDPDLETEAGMVLHLAVPDQDERRELLTTFMEYDKALSIYAMRVLGRPRFPAVSKMEFMPERLETRADDSGTDLRTDDEKIASARTNMRMWDDRLGKLQPWRASIIRSVSYQQDTLVRRGEVTAAGRSFVAAIRALKEVKDG